MAGSLKYFIYTANDGEQFALLADESNVEATSGTTVDYLDATAIPYWLPPNVQPRSAVYSSADGTRNIVIPIMTQALFVGIQGGATPTITDPIAGTGDLTLTRLTPEIITRLPKGIDTGLLDGDAT